MAEKAVAEFYVKSGYQVTSLESRSRDPVDFYATKDGVKLAVEVKSVRPRHFIPMMRMAIDRQLKHTIQQVEDDAFAKLQIVVVLREDDDEYPLSRLFGRALRFTEEFGSSVEIQFGRLNEEKVYVPIENHGGI
jgi:hypothetical protein